MKKIIIMFSIFLNLGVYSLETFQSSTIISSAIFGDNLNLLISDANVKSLDLSEEFPQEQSEITAIWFNSVIDVGSIIDGSDVSAYHVNVGQDITATLFNNVFNLLNDKIIAYNNIVCNSLIDEVDCGNESTCYWDDTIDGSCENRPLICDAADEMVCTNIIPQDGIPCSWDMMNSLCSISIALCNELDSQSAPYNTEAYCNSMIDPAGQDSNTCIYDQSINGCTYLPTSCMEAGSENICGQVNTAPCIWYNEICGEPSEICMNINESQCELYGCVWDTEMLCMPM